MLPLPLTLGVVYTIRNRHTALTYVIFTARNEVGARLCFYRCVWFCSQGGGVPDQVPPPRTRYTPLDQVHPPGPGTPPRTRYTSPGPGTPPRDQVHPPGPGTSPWDQVHPPDQVPPQTRYTLPDQVHPPDQVHLPPDQVHLPPDQVHPTDQGDTVYARAVRILLECILVSYLILPCDVSNSLKRKVQSLSEKVCDVKLGGLNYFSHLPARGFSKLPRLA